LPLGIAGRSDQEIDAMFIAWGAVAVWALARPARRAWFETLTATALAFASVPLVNALTTDRSLFASLAAGDTVFATFDGAMLLVAAGFGWAAMKAARRGRAQGGTAASRGTSARAMPGAGTA